MRSILALVLLLTPAPALAQDRFGFGDDLVVAAGERAHDVASFGGDVTVLGDVSGDLATFGGDAVVLGHVAGDVATFGGDLTLGEGASVAGEISTMGGSLEHRGAALHEPLPPPPSSPLESLAAWIHQALESAASFALLFLLALAMLGLVPERLRALEVVIAREPGRTGLRGVGAFLLAVVGIILLAITIIGIPAAVALGVALSAAGYVGLAAVAAVIGVILPVERLRDRPVMQLAAGVLTLYVASLVPGVGSLIVAMCAAVGLGAVVRTQLGKHVPPREGEGGSPYRSTPVPEAL
jgi:hypothetical protein